MATAIQKRGVFIDINTGELRRMQRMLQLTPKRMSRAAAAVVFEEAAETYGFIVGTKLNLPGKPVRRGGPSGPIPGAPEEPVLHRDTGALIRQVSKPRLTFDPRGWTITIGEHSQHVYYAKYHEWGWKKKGMKKRARRPFMRPARIRFKKRVRTALRVWAYNANLTKQGLGGLAI